MSKGLNYFIHDSDAVENETLSILEVYTAMMDMLFGL